MVCAWKLHALAQKVASSAKYELEAETKQHIESKALLVLEQVQESKTVAESKEKVNAITERIAELERQLQVAQVENNELGFKIEKVRRELLFTSVCQTYYLHIL